jgi:pSer/pThr/pTyr-binding forkhead associated (FHA) protein
MRLILEVMSGPFQGKQIEAEVGQTVRIGRTPQSEVALEDNFMSGTHFAVECELGGCRLRDLNSRNGTKLNGEVVTEALLNEGDQIHAGRTDFIVHIEDPRRTVRMGEQPTVRLTTGESVSLAKGRPADQPRRPSTAQIPESRPPAAVSPESWKAPEQPRPPTTPDVLEKPLAPEAPHPVASSPPRIESAPSSSVQAPPIQSAPLPSPPAEVILPAALDSYEAATPEGRLIHILSNQPQPLMALLDAVRDSRLLELLRDTTEEYQSLYRSEANAKIVPYLVRLPPRSELLKQMVQKGWGREWGVYLTCPLALAELREYFRTSLMVTMPDGMELFSRFYDPRFFRSFLETCTAAEAEKFFGPVTSYFMEDERREILLEFRRGKKGAEKKGHLLTVLS